VLSLGYADGIVGNEGIRSVLCKFTLFMVYEFKPKISAADPAVLVCRDIGFGVT